MLRRNFMAGAGAALAAPAIVRAQGAHTLKFIPQSDLTVLDPVWTTAYVTRNHGLMVFDTLFGQDGRYQASPQMLDGAAAEDGGKLWRLVLRPGLMFHDGTPVLARDCVASIRRWGKRDSFGQTLMAATDDLSAADDRTIEFRLKHPFPLLPSALGKSTSSICPIMPERLALTDPFKQVTEMVGSGPFRFKADERVVGARIVYERFDGYRPREGGVSDWTAGPKMAHFDRVEWQVVPDAATAAGALQAGEVDWWENPLADLVPLLRRTSGITVEIPNPTGQIPVLRMNQLQPPFDNPAIRRALLSAVSQADYLTAVVGDDPAMQHTPAGFFCPGTPMANDAGLAALKADVAGARAAILAAGYAGEPVVLLAPTDFPSLKALADVGADLMQRCGLKVDYQAMDWGSVVTRRSKKDPVAQGGWNVFHTFWDGLDHLNPATNVMLRGNGLDAAPGWPTEPKIEALRDQWLQAPNEAEQQALAAQIQLQAFASVPYIPLGQNFITTAYRGLHGVTKGFAMFWGVARA